jgi:hypothetical protein
MASSAAGAVGSEVSVGRVFSRAFGVMASNPVTMFGISFLLGAVPSGLMSYFKLTMRGAVGDRYAAIGMGVISLASGLVALVLAMLVQGALVRATIAYSEGRRASFSESASAGLAVAFPLLGLAILMGLGIGFGSILLLVPGIILFVMWSVASPALVEERIGVFEAFGRSNALTKGARWKIFGLELVALIVIWLLSAILGIVMVMTFGLGGLQAVARTGLPGSWLILNAALSTILTTFWGAVQTSLYVELRNWKEGPSAQGLETIFA